MWPSWILMRQTFHLGHPFAPSWSHAPKWMLARCLFSKLYSSQDRQTAGRRVFPVSFFALRRGTSTLWLALGLLLCVLQTAWATHNLRNNWTFTPKYSSLCFLRSSKLWKPLRLCFTAQTLHPRSAPLKRLSIWQVAKKPSNFTLALNELFFFLFRTAHVNRRV